LDVILRLDVVLRLDVNRRFTEFGTRPLTIASARPVTFFPTRLTPFAVLWTTFCTVLVVALVTLLAAMMI